MLRRNEKGICCVGLCALFILCVLFQGGCSTEEPVESDGQLHGTEQQIFELDPQLHVPEEQIFESEAVVKLLREGGGELAETSASTPVSDDLAFVDWDEDPLLMHCALCRLKEGWKKGLQDAGVENIEDEIQDRLVACWPEWDAVEGDEYALAQVMLSGFEIMPTSDVTVFRLRYRCVSKDGASVALGAILRTLQPITHKGNVEDVNSLRVTLAVHEGRVAEATQAYLEFQSTLPPTFEHIDAKESECLRLRAETERLMEELDDARTLRTTLFARVVEATDAKFAARHSGEDDTIYDAQIEELNAQVKASEVEAEEKSVEVELVQERYSEAIDEIHELRGLQGRDEALSRSLARGKRDRDAFLNTVEEIVLEMVAEKGRLLVLSPPTEACLVE